MDKEQYKSKIKRMVQEGEAKKMCFLCGEDEPSILKEFENHHLWGKANSDDKILLCLNCHAYVTNKQNQLSPEIRSRKATPLNRKLYSLFSFFAFLKRGVSIGEKMISDIIENEETSNKSVGSSRKTNQKEVF